MPSKIIRSIFVLNLLVCSLGYTFSRDVGELDQEIRVAVFQNLTDFVLTVQGPFSLVELNSGHQLLKSNSFKDVKVSASADGIMIKDEKYACTKIQIQPQYDTTISIKKRKFRGKINIILGANHRMTVVNVVGLEDYIKGVLYHEVSPRWPIEALKAQAIAARTYAIYRIQHATVDFDVTNDIYSQVYGGKTSERYRTNLAVNRTQEQVLMYQGKILPAYFHATCAGHTENVSELWAEHLLPLKGTTCPFCSNSPHFNWRKNFRLKDIQDKLNQNGFNLGLIKEITILERNESGRIRRLQITTRDGQTAVVSGKDFRNMIGPNIIKSNNYEIVMQGYYMDLIGKGWGHGVGLCQWGARQMALEHYSSEEILQYYYPTAEIVNYQKRPLKFKSLN